MIAREAAQGVRADRVRAATRTAAAVMLFPIYWMVATAFKPGVDILRLEPKWFPNPITFQNFQDAIERPFFLDDVRNSLVIVGVMLVLALLIAFLAAVATARFGF
ncbi:MAG: carbohydrate ABC transporter permease, partial [Chloroflexi bacterium]